MAGETREDMTTTANRVVPQLYRDCVGRFCPPDFLPYLAERAFDRAVRRLSAQDLREYWRRLCRWANDRGDPDPTLSVYVHVPFCNHVCHFCDLGPVRAETREVASYLGAVLNELDFFSPLFEGLSFQSVFMGGGTPSVLSPEQLETLLSRLFSALRIYPRGERCIEVHPGNFTPEKLDLVCRFGINKINVGIQSFDPDVLRAENRTDQSAQDVDLLCRAVRERSSIVCFNVDLMIGLQGQALGSFMSDLERCLDYGPDTITVYFLKSTEDYVRRLYGGRLGAPARARDALMASAEPLVRRAIEKRGYGFESYWDHWYFLRPGWSSSWDQGSYVDRSPEPGSILGLGSPVRSKVAGALAYRSRRGLGASFDPSVPAYVAKRLSPRLEWMKYILSQLGGSDRVSRSEFQAYFGVDLAQRFRKPLQVLESKGFVRVGEDDVQFGGDARARLVSALFLNPPGSMRRFLDTYNYGNFRLRVGSPPAAWDMWIERAQDGRAYLDRHGRYGLVVSETVPPHPRFLDLARRGFRGVVEGSDGLCADEMTARLGFALDRLALRRFPGFTVREGSRTTLQAADGRGA